MEHASFTNSHDLLDALALSMNIIAPVVQNHHEQTAYLSYFIANELGISYAEREKVVLAALLHDVGVIFTEDPQTTLDFEANAYKLAHVGAHIVSGSEGFEEVGTIIRFSQHRWVPDRLPPAVSPTLFLYASIVHLADRVSVCLNDRMPALNQAEGIRILVEMGRGTEFGPQVVDAFMRVAEKPSLWMDLVYHPVPLVSLLGHPRSVSLEQTVQLTHFMSRLIDFRSAFTAMHSAGVRASAVRLAELVGMSEEECLMMSVAGDLHDIGKIRVPREILEKPGKLTTQEFNVIQDHTYFTYQILRPIQGFEQIAAWAAFHHERLNGRGYPFRLKAHQISLGSRIMAVADIFSAVTEVRPYRAGMEREAVERVMRDNVANGATSGVITDLLLKNYDDVNAARDQASREAGGRYFSAIEASEKPLADSQ
ncbi:MAG: HD domain-containing protein [Coriobacteriales bacterium]|nr:HD domain-containing protein [Coriobacteriales bacterium]